MVGTNVDVPTLVAGRRSNSLLVAGIRSTIAVVENPKDARDGDKELVANGFGVERVDISSPDPPPLPPPEGSISTVDVRAGTLDSCRTVDSTTGDEGMTLVSVPTVSNTRPSEA